MTALLATVAPHDVSPVRMSALMIPDNVSSLTLDKGPPHWGCHRPVAIITVDNDIRPGDQPVLFKMLAPAGLPLDATVVAKLKTTDAG